MKFWTGAADFYQGAEKSSVFPKSIYSVIVRGVVISEGQLYWSVVVYKIGSPVACWRLTVNLKKEKKGEPII